MPQVPKNIALVNDLGKAQGPEPIDMWMALSTMHSLGRFAEAKEAGDATAAFKAEGPSAPYPDVAREGKWPQLEGRIEDRRQDEAELAAQMAAAKRIRRAVRRG